MPDEVTTTLQRVASELPGGGESRPGQVEMAEAVAAAVVGRRNLVVQAGTGTGKSLAYLVPAALSGERIVVATATKALQDQLADKDLPLVAAATDNGLRFAVLKGRSNYVCRQRVSEIGGPGAQLALTPGSADPPDADDSLTPTADVGSADPTTLADQVRSLVRWADDTTTGDRAELPFEPHFRAWAMVSTTARECPGAFRCPSGRDCFAEDARARAAEADVIVVNTHLYGAHLASGGAVLPEHQVVVFDEAHEVEDVMTDSLGLEVGPGRFRALAVAARPVLGDDDGASRAVEGVADLADVLHRVLRPWSGRRVPHGTCPTAHRPWIPAAAAGCPGTGRYDRGLGHSAARADRPSGRQDASRSGSTSGSLRCPRRRKAAPRPVRARTTRWGTTPTSPPCSPWPRGGSDGSSTTFGDPNGTPATRDTSADRSRRDRVLLAAGHLAADLARLALSGPRRSPGSRTAPGRRPSGCPPSTSGRFSPSSSGARSPAS